MNPWLFYVGVILVGLMNILCFLLGAYVMHRAWQGGQPTAKEFMSTLRPWEQAGRTHAMSPEDRARMEAEDEGLDPDTLQPRNVDSRPYAPSE